MDGSATLTTKIEKMCLKASPLDTRSSKAKSEKATAVADSWEDEEVSSGADDDEKDGDEPPTPTVAKPGVLAPPPTPITSVYTTSDRPFASMGPTFEEGEGAGKMIDRKRPEKTDAVARRMIASALGVKVPKMTDEQKAYDKALREKERKRKDQDRESAKRQEEEASKARQAVWED